MVLEHISYTFLRHFGAFAVGLALGWLGIYRQGLWRYGSQALILANDAKPEKLPHLPVRTMSQTVSRCA